MAPEIPVDEPADDAFGADGCDSDGDIAEADLD